MRIQIWGFLRWAPALVLCAAAGLTACSEPTEAPVAQQDLVSLEADAVFYDMDDFLTQEGVRSGLIRADTAYAFKDSSHIRMWGVEMTLYHADGTERAFVTSLRGTLNQRTEEMHALGDVVLLLDGGVRKVESPELYYDPGAERIWSDSTTVYTDDGRVTRGSCFRSNLEFTNLEVCAIRGSAGIRREGGGG